MLCHQPGNKFEIKLGRKQVRLAPMGGVWWGGVISWETLSFCGTRALLLSIRIPMDPRQ